MKRSFKQMVTILFLILLLTGCSQSTEGFVTVTEEAQETIWCAEYTFLEKEYQYVTVKGDIIYACYGENGDTVIDYMNKSATIERRVVVEGISSVLTLDVDERGNIYVVGVNDSGNKLIVVEKNGSVKELDNLVLTDTEMAEDLLPKGVMRNNQGHYLVWYEMTIPIVEIIDGQEETIWRYVDRIYVMDEQFNTLFYSQIDDVKGVRVQDVQLNSKGNPVFVVKDREGMFTRTVDIQSQKLQEEVRLASVENIVTLTNITVIESGFLYLLGNELYEYNIKTQKNNKLLALYDYGIDAEEILYIGKNGADIEIIDNSASLGSSEYIVLQEGASDKLVLTLGTLNASVDLEKAVSEFNRYNKDLQIKIVNYYNEYDEDADYRDGLEQLKLDIVTSDAPDIIEVSSIDMDMLATKGVFVDLYKYMDIDTECSREMAIPSVLKAYEINEHLYSISPSFQLYSMWGNPKLIGDKIGISLQQLIQTLNNVGKNLNAISGFSADEPVLRTLCTFAMDEFIDWEKGTCDFEGEYFQELLQFAKEYDGGFSGGSTALGVRQGDVVMSVGMIYSVADYQIQKEIYEGDISFIGYPVKEGSGTAVSFRGSQLAINAGKEHQDEAWAFVKFYLLNGYDDTGFPVMKEQFEEAMQQAMESNVVKDENGSYEMPKGNYITDDTGISVFAATEEDVEEVRRLVETVQHRFEYHTEIMEIIETEAEYYFNGQKDIGQITNTIQNRVSLYLEEQK